MFCIKCGKHIQEGSRFCTGCGAKTVSASSRPKRSRGAWSGARAQKAPTGMVSLNTPDKVSIVTWWRSFWTGRSRVFVGMVSNRVLVAVALVVVVGLYGYGWFSSNDKLNWRAYVLAEPKALYEKGSGYYFEYQTYDMRFDGKVHRESRSKEEAAKEAGKWLGKAVAKRHAKATLLLGDCYYRGDIVTRDLSRAAVLYERAAEAGLPESQYKIGKCYFKGEGVLADTVRAVGWYKVAAKRGYRDAQYTYAECFEFGLGTAVNLTDAFVWYRLAGDQDDVHALYALSRFYLEGAVVERNTSLAAKAFSRASSIEDAEVQCGYNHPRLMIYGKMLDEQGYLEYAAKGDKNAQCYLGIKNLFGYDDSGYCHGGSCQSEVEEGVRLLERASLQEVAGAQFQIGVCYLNGLGVKENADIAVQWLTQAAMQGHERSRAVLNILVSSSNGSHSYDAIIQRQNGRRTDIQTSSASEGNESQAMVDFNDYKADFLKGDLASASTRLKRLDSVLAEQGGQQVFCRKTITPASSYRLLRILLLCKNCDDDGTCPSCKGEKCPECKGGKICAKCAGNSVRKKVCDRCLCSECAATGKCRACNGQGTVVCSACKGIGSVSTESDLPCGACGGSGARSGLRRSDGSSIQMRCLRCNGKGVLRSYGSHKCEQCMGKGKIQCDACQGQCKCGSCNGHRRTAFCDACGSSGQVSMTCPKCLGSGTCATCDGTGHSKCKVCSNTGLCVKCNASGLCKYLELPVSVAWLSISDGCWTVEPGGHLKSVAVDADGGISLAQRRCKLQGPVQNGDMAVIIPDDTVACSLLINKDAVESNK